MSDKVTELKCPEVTGSACPSDNLDAVRTAQIAKTPDYNKEPLAGLPAIEELKTYLQTNFDRLDLNHDGRITSDEFYRASTKLKALDDAASSKQDLAKASNPVELDTGYTEEMFLANDFSRPKVRNHAPYAAALPPNELDPPGSNEADSFKRGSANDKKNIEVLDTNLHDVHLEIDTNNLLEEIFTPGISRNGLATLGRRIDEYKKWRSEQKEAVPFAYNLANYGSANFDKLDKSYDGRLSIGEVDEALKSAINPEDRQELDALKKVYDHILYPFGKPRLWPAIYSRAGIEREDFEVYLNAQYENWLYRFSPDKLPDHWQLQNRFSRTEHCDAKLRSTLLDR
jgi:hypothetical protein